MIKRRATVGLSLLCALALCALAAQSASAKGTTAFTCSPVTPGTGNFNDAHCDNEEPKQNFGHVVIAPGTSTLVETANEKVSHETKVTEPWLFRYEVGGVKGELECKSVVGKATITNKEIEKVMQTEGTQITTEFTNCTVLRPENAAEERHPCKVAEPIVQKSTSITKENLGGGGKEMGMEFKPEAGKPLTEITFEGANCSLKGTKAELTGTLIATGAPGSSLATTHSGATEWFTTAMCAETLKFAAKTAETKITLTMTMYNAATKETENPISYTTTEP